MKGWVGWVLLAVSLVVTYQGWTNSRPTRDTLDRSRGAACEGAEGCTVVAEQPRSVRTDFLARHYEWKTSGGVVTVRCERAYVFAGAWACRTGS